MNIDLYGNRTAEEWIDSFCKLKQEYKKALDKDIDLHKKLQTKGIQRREYNSNSDIVCVDDDLAYEIDLIEQIYTNLLTKITELEKEYVHGKSIKLIMLNIPSLYNAFYETKSDLTEIVNSRKF